VLRCHLCGFRRKRAHFGFRRLLSDHNNLASAGSSMCSGNFTQTSQVQSLVARVITFHPWWSSLSQILRRYSHRRRNTHLSPGATGQPDSTHLCEQTVATASHGSVQVTATLELSQPIAINGAYYCLLTQVFRTPPGQPNRMKQRRSL